MSKDIVQVSDNNLSSSKGTVLSRTENDTIDSQICPNCQQNSQIIWVHGHGQCSNCGVNVLPCCNGEQCQI